MPESGDDIIITRKNYAGHFTHIKGALALEAHEECPGYVDDEIWTYYTPEVWDVLHSKPPA